MALANALFFLTVCVTCLVFCAGSPTRRQFISYSDTETSSSAPARIVTSDEVWDDSDDFDLDDGENWMGDVIVTPSTIPEYQDYDGERYDEAAKDSRKGVGEDDDDVETQDAEEEETPQLRNGPDEFLFLPSKDSNLLLEIESEKSSPIKVRHTGKNSFSDLSGNLIDDSKYDGDDDKFHGQFEFTVDNDDEDDDTDDNAINASNDDIVIEDTVQPKDSYTNNVEEESKTASNSNDNNVDNNNVDDDDDAADNTDDDEEDDDDQLFDSDDSQVIYGDHVFLY